VTLSGVSPADDVDPLVEGRQQDGVEVARPDAVVRLLGADVQINEGVREVEQPPSEVEGAGGGHALHQGVRGVLGRGRRARVRSRRERVARRRRWAGAGICPFVYS
jgi:hypothetical protein